MQGGVKPPHSKALRAFSWFLAGWRRHPVFDVCEVRDSSLASRGAIVLRLRIAPQVLGREIIRWNKAIVLLQRHGNFPGMFIKLEEGDHGVLHKQRADRPTDEVGKLVPAQPYVLPNLHQAELVLFGFRLHGQNIMSPSPVDTHVDLIGFYLADLRNGRSEMALK